MSEITTEIQARNSPYSADPMNVFWLLLIVTFVVKVVPLIS